MDPKQNTLFFGSALKRCKTGKITLTGVSLLSMMVAAGSAASAQQLDEIVVTAQKRQETLQEVPISVTAIGGESIIEDGVQRLEDLATYVPNLVVREGFAGETLAVRGFGSNQNPSFEQAVSTFIDGVYFGRAKQSLASFLDLERVEVLRGPQSTFFGNNAIAGALNLTTKRPGAAAEGFVHTSYNPDDNELDLTGAATIPVSETLGFRAAVKYLKSDGYLEDFDGNKLPEKENIVGRLSALWQPTDNFEVFIKGEIGSEETVGATAQIVDCPLSGSAFTPVQDPLGPRGNVGNGLCDLAQRIIPGLTFEFDEVLEPGGMNPATVIPIADTQINSVLGQVGGQFRNLDTKNANLTMSYEAENGITLTSVTGYTEYDSDRQFDVDTTPLASISTNRQEEFSQWSQELRVVSPGGETVDWLAGVYYQSNDVDFDYQTYTLIDSPDGANPGGPPGGNGVHGFILGLFAGDYEESQDTWAVFGSASWNPTDDLRATVGLRYSEVDKEGTNILSLGISGNNAAVPVDSAAATVPFFGSPAGPPFVAHNITDSISSNELTYQFNLQYDFSDAIMGYATVANGFKAGGFDNLIRLPETYPTNAGLCSAGDPRPPCGGNPAGIAGTSSGGSFSFSQEIVNAYEIGLKMKWPAVRVNLAAFINTFDDLQQSVFNPTAIAFQIRNAGAAKSQGIELDAQWAATDNLVLTAAGTVLDAKYTEFTGASCDRASTNAGLLTCDLSGARLPYTPDWSATFGARHTLPISLGRLAIFTNANLVLSGDYRSGVELDPRFEVGSYQLLDARIALGDIDRNWSIGVWGKNLTDELLPGISTYGAVRSVGPYISTTQRPLSWGVSGNYKF